VENKKKQKPWYDKNAKRSEDTYFVDQPIYVQDKFNKLWNPAKIVKKLSELGSLYYET